MHNNRSNYVIEYIIIFLIGFTSSFYIVQINGQPICIWLMFLMILYISITKAKFVIKKRIYPFFMFYICILLSSFAQTYITGTNTKSMLVIYGAIVLFSCTLHLVSNKGMECFVKGLKISLIAQLGWCILQYIFYMQKGMDINNLIFVDTLHLVERMSKLYAGNYVVTGLCWHPSNLVFVVILLLLFYPKWYMWLLCMLVALLSKNSTLIIAILVVALLLCISKIHANYKNKSVKFNAKRLLIFLMSTLLFVWVIVSTGVLVDFVSQAEHILYRISGISGDISSSVHMSYYLRYFDIVEKSNPYTFLFGYGYGYSGYPITEYYGQYLSLNSWTVESDVMNLLYGTGVVGFVVYYIWLLGPIRKAFKLEPKYVIMIISLIICGITYNNQLSWVIVDEVLIFECIEREINIFGGNEKQNMKKASLYPLG